MGETKLVSIGLFERHELSTVLILEVHCLEGDEIEVGEGTGGREVYFDKFSALFVAVVDAVAAQKRSYIITILAKEGQRDGLTAQEQQFHKRTALFFAAGIESKWHKQ